MLILVIIMLLIGSLFLTFVAASGFVLLYTGQTDVKEIGSERVEFEITGPTSKKNKKKKQQISCDLNELG